MTETMQREPLDYATPRRTDVRRHGVMPLLFTGLALVLFGGVFLIGGFAMMSDLIFRGNFNAEIRDVIMTLIGGFSFTCLIAGLVVIRAAMKRTR